MTAHDLHDALNLLPADLITAADRVRTAPRALVVPWQRWVSLAAVLALVLGTSLVFAREMMPGIGSDKKESVAAQAPAAAAPMTPRPAEQEVAADEAIPEEPAADSPETGAISSNAVTGGKDGQEDELYIDHSHRFAEVTESAGATGAYCGNTATTVYLNGEEYSIGGSDSVEMTRILKNLPYDPAQVCRCMAEFAVDTETRSGIEVNLTEAFARCEQGQAALSEKQVAILREIIEKLQ